LHFTLYEDLAEMGYFTGGATYVDPEIFVGKAWQRGRGGPIQFSGKTFMRGRGYRGAGFGSWLTGLWRNAIAPIAVPYLKSTLRDIGKSSIKSALDLTGDILTDKTSLRESGIKTLKKIMRDSGDIAYTNFREQTGLGRRRRRRKKGRVGRRKGAAKLKVRRGKLYKRAPKRRRRRRKGGKRRRRLARAFGF
jgi:hypothetical protein